MKAVFIAPLRSSLGFEPMMWLRSQEMIRTFGELGVQVFPIDVSAEPERPQELSRAVGEIKPDFITAVNFNYLLEALWQEADLLDRTAIPIVALWDDPLGGLALYLDRVQVSVNGKRPTSLPGKINDAIKGRITGVMKRFAAESSEMNALVEFGKIMRHPRLRHFSWDTGHIAAVDLLRLTDSERVQWYPMVTYAPFLRAGSETMPSSQTSEIAFCGNVYLDWLRKHPYWNDRRLRLLTTRICTRKARALDKPLWALMTEEMDQLSPAERRKLGLSWDRKSFWDYYRFAVWHAANTLVRLEVLGQIRADVDVFGLFADPQSRDLLRDHPNLNFRGNRHHFDELPNVYRSAKINICISNGLNFQGIPSKFIDCLASGGFALTDPKEDLVRLFGESVTKIFFRDADELNEKIEYFLCRPAERKEIVNEFHGRIEQRCTLKNLFEQVVAFAKA